MKLLSKLTDWILYTSLFAASSAVGMCMATERLLIEKIPSVFSPLHLLIFGSTLSVYNLHYLFKKSDEGISDRYTWSKHYKTWHYLFLATGIGMCTWSLFFLPREILNMGVVLAFLSLAYSLPLLPFKNKKRLKEFGLVKIWILAGVWTIVTGILPMLYWGSSVLDYPFEILIRAAFLLALCIAFDIRDMQTDLEAGIMTLPNSIGLKNSYRIIDVAIVSFVLLSIIQYSRYPSAGRLAGEIITAVATWLVIAYTKKHPSDKAYLGLVDGMMLLYAILMLLH